MITRRLFLQALLALSATLPLGQKAAAPVTLPPVEEEVVFTNYVSFDFVTMELPVKVRG